MTLDAAIWASSTALTSKVALACWITASMLLHNQRHGNVSWRLLTYLVVLLTSVLASRQTTVSLDGWLWSASAFLAIAALAASARQWLNIRPRAVFEEAALRDELVKKNRRGKKPVQAQTVFAPIRASKWLLVVHFLGLVCTATALGFGCFQLVPIGVPLQWLVVTHVIATSILLGATLCAAMELTFGIAPGALSLVNWQTMANLALGCCVAELLVGAVLLARPIRDAQDLQAVLLSRLFAISVLVIYWIAWIIPRRVANFKRTGKATGWVSLTLAAWVCVLSLSVLAALPGDWPWMDL